MSRSRARLWLFVLLLAGAWLRLRGLNWDGNHHLHPDERFISMVEEKLVGPGSLRGYLDSKTSKLNPYNIGHGSFVYGTLPMLLAHWAGKLVGKTGYDGTFLVGRVLSTIFDLVSVWLVYRIARRFAGRRTALAASALLAGSPLAIQLSHFWTVDTFLATFSTAALLSAVRLAQGRRDAGTLVLAAAATGLAVSCKVTGLALLGPVGLGLLIGSLPPPGPRRPGAWARSAAAVLVSGLVILVLSAAVVRVAFPYAFASSNLLSFRPDSRWVSDLTSLNTLVKHVSAFPPNFQWAGRTFAFPMRNLVIWGASPFFGVPALAGLVWALLSVRRRMAWAVSPLVLHVLILFAYHGFTLGKSMRYFYPTYSALAVLAALALKRFAGGAPAATPRWRRLAAAACVAGTLVCGLAFTSIYSREHTRVTGSRWIYAHVQPPRLFLNETWDDGLPLPLPGFDSGQYSGPQPNIVGPDNAGKVAEIVDAMAKADGIAITSNRAYGTLTRIPDVFPMTRAYYQALFDGRLGYRLVADVTSYPSLGPIVIPDDASEEAFTVYDHPRVLLFRKEKDFSPERVRSILMAALPQTPPTLNDWENWPRSRQNTVAPISPPRRKDVATENRPLSTARVGSLVAALVFYAAVSLLGLAALPLAFALFPRLDDRGFGFARLLGLVLATYTMAAILWMRLLPNGRGLPWLCLVVVGVLSALAIQERQREILSFLATRRRSLLFSEMVFAFGFLLFVGFRALNPEIYWGEKPMDFSILNILVRTRGLPPSDPWFAGAPLGYYFFGQEMVALLTQMTHLPTRFTFNLAFGLLGGTILQGAFALAGNWGRRLRAGVAGAVLTLLVGNLSGLREWLVNKRHLDWDYFWATSRVVKDTINEYPLWSLLFADLHAHVFGIPILILFLAAALHFVRVHADPLASWPRRLLTALLLGFLGGVQALTNAWEAPLLAGLLLLVIPMAAFLAAPRTLSSAGRVAASSLLAAGSTLFFARTMWVRGAGSPGMGKNLEPGASGLDVATVFGLFFFLAAAWWLSTVLTRWKERGAGAMLRWGVGAAASAGLALAALRAVDVFLAAGIVLFLVAVLLLPEEKDDRLAFGLIATSFFLVLFPQRFYIADRMNTFFKLYLEAWVLLAIATAVLVFRGPERRGTFGSWFWLARIAAVLLFAASVFTGVTAARAAVSRHFAPYSGPSLDGLRYLEEQRPGEYKAVLWLNENVRGTPVMLEAQGPSYQDFSRITMLTGLPTVLGWEYHVKQRGNPESEIQARKDAVLRIYESKDAARIEPLLRRYHVGYVYDGWLERKTYAPAGMKKFAEAKNLFTLVYENPETRIYRVIGGDSDDVVTAPTREPLPEPTPGGEQLEPEEPPSILKVSDHADPPFFGLKEPRGAAVDGQSRIWIADFGHSRLRIYDSEGGALGGWGGRGDGVYGFRELCGIAISGDTIYVADTWNGRLEAFSLEGEPRGAAVGLYGPRSVAVAPDGHVWATDTGNHRVVRYDSGFANPLFVGKKGSAPGQFSNPVGIAVGPSGHVYVADTDNRRIQVLNGDGTVLRVLPFPGWEEIAEPHIAVDRDERLYVSDPGAHAVVVLDAEGKVLSRRVRDDAGQTLSRPTGLAIDPRTRILYIVNSGNNSVSFIHLSERNPA